MATQDQVRNDPRYICVHNHGFVGLIDHMGSDQAIDEAARVSYGGGTRKVNETRGLVRYLYRHQHTSPFEMGEVKFHIKLPIFIMRQLVRHRTASLNEYSARYSILTNEFYVPETDYICEQSKTNKQGAGEQIDIDDQQDFQRDVENCSLSMRRIYESWIDRGLSRETARIVVPVNQYTECYWKCDLHNFFRCMRLRLDKHAQREIRDLSEAMYRLVRPLFPISCEAFEDYSLHSLTLSRMEVTALRDLLVGKLNPHGAQHYGMSDREWKEFQDRWSPRSINP